MSESFKLTGNKDGKVAKASGSIVPGAVYLDHARNEEQLADMEKIAERDICFMCPEHIPEFYEQRDGLIAEGEHSFLVHNGYPYENTEHHFMVLPKEHIERLEDITDEFIVEAFTFFKQLEEEHGISGGAVAMRFGDPAVTGATANHLHIHLIVPKVGIEAEDEPVRFRMSKKFSSPLSKSVGKVATKKNSQD